MSLAILPDKFFLRDAWYMVAWPSEVTAQEPLARTVLGDDLVLFRTAAGEAVALEDRCAHRLAPLSKGRIESDGIRCMYHGVKFGAVGQCLEIPAQPQGHPNMCVRRYPLVEKDGFLWVWMGIPEQADTTKIIDAPWAHDPRWAPSQGYLHVHAHMSLVADNLLDFGHLPFVHPNTVGSVQQADFSTQVTPLTEGVQTDRWYIDVPASRFHQSVGRFPGNVDAWHCFRWHLPAVMSLDSGSAPTGTGARDKPHGSREGAIEFHHIAALTPQDEDHTHYFWIHWRNFEVDNPEMTDIVHRNIMAAFAEDQAMVEAQHRAVRRGAQTVPKAIMADKALTIIRQQVAKRV
ncbi:MAG: aromatic ring-hydroxylating dioxygenase subunit alpha [Alphaproteobacteria bacterium]|nr:aromatic ring-hydroxylating dioxygenase subunit alpha [Alphaproteobacteria bacterium]